MTTRRFLDGYSCACACAKANAARTTTARNLERKFNAGPLCKRWMPRCVRPDFPRSGFHSILPLSSQPGNRGPGAGRRSEGVNGAPGRRRRRAEDCSPALRKSSIVRPGPSLVTGHWSLAKKLSTIQLALVARHGRSPMTHTIEKFAAACHDILKAEPNPAGRKKVCTLLQEYLKDKQFVSTYLKDETPERKILYEDSELGFCVLAHHYRGAKESPPHDHGPYWAIYGQAVGETEMSDYQLLEPAAVGKAGKVRKTKTYKLTPGIAHVYN